MTSRHRCHVQENISVSADSDEFLTRMKLEVDRCFTLYLFLFVAPPSFKSYYKYFFLLFLSVSSTYYKYPFKSSDLVLFQLNDCHRGVVFDGLETLFSQTMFTTCKAILKAFNNRKYIYFVTLKQEYSVLKEQEKKAQEERGKHPHMISSCQINYTSTNATI